MQYTHDRDQANSYSREALELIAREGLSPTPDIFELWYVYFSGQNPEVRRALDLLMENRLNVTNERCRELHQRFLREGHDEEAILRAGDQISKTIENVSGAAQNLRDASTNYNSKLDDVRGQVANVKDSGDLKKILSNVMADTHAMMSQNQKLEEELNKSTSTMKELQRDLENVRREAMTDGLTGLANRKAFEVEIKRLIDEARAEGTPFSLMMIDIDHFKNFNDNYGHQVGDQVLRLVARTLVDGVKGRDFTARYGGEEFVILLPHTKLDSATMLANNLRRAVAAREVINRNSGEKLAKITMSVGVAEYTVEEESPDLIERADAALYTAKHNGRNQVASSPTPKPEKKKEKR